LPEEAVKQEPKPDNDWTLAGGEEGVHKPLERTIW